MKIKIFALIVIAILILTSILIIFMPVELQRQKENSLNDGAMQAGAYYIYTFNAAPGNTYSNSNSQIDYASPCGVLKLTVISNNMVAIREKVCCGASPTENYCIKNNVSMNNNLILYFLNSISMPINSIIKLPCNSIGTPKVDGFSYRIIYLGNNSQLAATASDLGVSSPTEVQLDNVNMSNVTGNAAKFCLSQFGNQMDYDHNGQTNILVRAFITGGFPFLNLIFNNKALIFTVGFNLNLIDTSVALHPLDFSHYAKKDIVAVPIIWIFGVTFLIMTVRNSRKRIGKKKILKKGKDI